MSPEVLKVLAYYADVSNYRNADYGYQLIMPIELDRGEKARKLLEALNPNQRKEPYVSQTQH